MNTNKENTSVSTNAARPIYSISPFTLLDYPDKTACILWFAGCNMRCSYCYNPDIVFGKGKITYETAITFLRSRKNLLDGVVLSGGECTSHKHLPEFLHQLKELGFLIKIDTNGSHPKKLEKFIENNLVDYIALDFKALSGKFEAITHSQLFTNFSQSLQLLIENNFPFEVRTTVHAELLSADDIREMAGFLENSGYRNTYYIQHYRNNSHTIAELPNSSPYYLNNINLHSELKIEFRNT